MLLLKQPALVVEQLRMYRGLVELHKMDLARTALERDATKLIYYTAVSS